MSIEQYYLHIISYPYVDADFYKKADVDIDKLKLLGINAVSLANNHMFDYGHEGYETTKKVLTEAGIDFFGAEGKELYVEFEDNNTLVRLRVCTLEEREENGLRPQRVALE